MKGRITKIFSFIIITQTFLKTNHLVANATGYKCSHYMPRRKNSKLEVRSIHFILKEEKIGILSLRDQTKEVRWEAINTGPIPLSPYLVLIMFTWPILTSECSTNTETLGLSTVYRID